MEFPSVFSRFVRTVCLAVVLWAPATALRAEPAVTVDVAHTVRRTDRHLLGINLNYLLDADANRRPGARPLMRAILDLGAGTLRYPGGAKSDVTLWSAPPFRRPAPTLARIGTDEWPSNDKRLYDLDHKRFKTLPFDFDSFIRLCRATGAEPVVVVAHDSMYRPGKDGAVVPNMAELLENAVSWVRYANIERGYGVKYWEIGNESYFYTYDGGSRAEDYARDLVVFSAAMKGVDPTIRIGANGPAGTDDVGVLDNLNGGTTPWWQVVFGQAAGSFDFIAVHEYPCYAWYGYDAYRTEPVRMLAVSNIDAAARRYGPPGLADRLRYLLTEVNSADWYGHPQNPGWKHENTLGHALVLFDMLAQAISDPRVVTAQIWATRWLNNDTKPQLWDALDGRNRLLPTGMAVKLLSQTLGSRLVGATDAPEVRTVAAMDDRKELLTVFLLNKDTERDVTVRLDGGRPGRQAERAVWSGTGPEDHAPTLRRESPERVARGEVRVHLPAVSLTILTVSLTPENASRLRASRKVWGPRNGAAASGRRHRGA